MLGNISFKKNEPKATEKLSLAISRDFCSRVFLTLHPSLEGFQWETKASKIIM